MKILGERFGKKFGKGKKSDMDFVKTDLSKVRRLQEELVVEVRNFKLMTQEITKTIETLQTKSNSPPDPTNDENEDKNTSGDADIKNNDLNNIAKTGRSFETPKIVTTHSLGKKFKRIQKKTNKSEESLSDSESESSGTTSPNSSEEQTHKSKKNQRKSKKKGGQKDINTDEENDMHETPPFPVPQMTNPMQDFRQNVYHPGQR